MVYVRKFGWAGRLEGGGGVCLEVEFRIGSM